MLPQDAYRAPVGNEVDHLPLGRVQGPRRGDAGAGIHPSGIGVVVPQRALGRAQPMPDYFHAFEESFNRFPIQLRGPGRLPGAGRRPHRVPHLRRARMRRGPRWQHRQKKMNVVQLTFIVMVNMMGSASSCCRRTWPRSARSRCCRAVTALVASRSRAASRRPIFNQRSGGLAAHCRGRLRQGRLLPGLLPAFLSLAIANVAGDLGAATWRAFPRPDGDADATAIRRSRVLLDHHGGSTSAVRA